jgi:hypothetical protein
MTTTTPAKRPVVGLLFALAGLLATLSLIFSLVHASVGGVWFGIITDIAITLGFLLLTLGRGSGTIARLFFAIATVGWAILAINGILASVGAGNLGTFFYVGVYLALGGSLLGGIFAFAGKIFSRVANSVFLLATLLMALVLLNVLVPYLSGSVADAVIGIYAILLLLAGILIAVRR